MSIGEKATTAIDQTQAQLNEAAVSAALAVLDRFCGAEWRRRTSLARDTALPALPAGRGQDAGVASARAYLGDFFARAGADWHHSGWDFRKVIAAGAAKVHLDVQFTRYRADNSVIGSFRSLWIVTKESGRWAVAARSSFAD